MGVDTKVKFTEVLEIEDVLSIIQKKIDPKASIHGFKETNMGKASEFEGVVLGDSWIIKSGQIRLSYKGDVRDVFYYQDNNVLSGKEDIKQLIEDKQTWMFDSRVSLSLSRWGYSIEMMKLILEEVGGYLDEDDCDAEDYYYIPKKHGRNCFLISAFSCNGKTEEVIVSENPKEIQKYVSSFVLNSVSEADFILNESLITWDDKVVSNLEKQVERLVEGTGQFLVYSVDKEGKNIEIRCSVLLTKYF